MPNRDPIDMSSEAVTERLRLASELTRLCLSLMAAGEDSRNQANSEKADAQSPRHVPPL